MKNLVLLVLALYAFSLKAENIRDLCENAYYATGYVKLHQYKLTIDWSYVSDHNLKLLEDVVYGDHFQVLEEKDLIEKTIYKLKEVPGFDYYDYVSDLDTLKMVSLNKVECLYDL